MLALKLFHMLPAYFTCTASILFIIIAQIQISTPDAYTYQAVGIDISDETSFAFEVEACNDAHVLLMKTPGDENNDVIEIVIGK